MTKIGFIRHGCTAWNKEKRAQGVTNIPLDEEGIQQAVALADRLTEEQWNVIYTSDLMRAHRTAEIIAEKLGIDEVHIDERLREMSGGLTEGKTMDERVSLWGENWKELDLGAEKPDDGMARGLACVQDIVAKHPDKSVLVVSHGALLRNTLRGLSTELSDKERLNNTSITVLRHAESKWSCELYNCTKHLTI